MTKEEIKERKEEIRLVIKFFEQIEFWDKFNGNPIRKRSVPDEEAMPIDLVPEQLKDYAYFTLLPHRLRNKYKKQLQREYDKL